MTDPINYPRDFPNPQSDKQIVPLKYGLSSKAFQGISVRITDVLDSSTRIAEAVSMFRGYLLNFYGKPMTMLTINRNMFEKGSPALGDSISQAGKEWPLVIVDDRDPACNFSSWAAFKLPAGTTVIETPGNFNASRGGMIWEFGVMPNYRLCMWMGSESHMLDKFGERPVNYGANPGQNEDDPDKTDEGQGGDGGNVGGGVVVGSAELVSALNATAEKIDKLADGVIGLTDVVLAIFNRK